MQQDNLKNKTDNSDKPNVSASDTTLVFDWNKLTLDQMVEYLRQKFMFDSSGDAKCIYHLIEFYDKHK